jgi:hypothetical protein
MGGQDNRKGFKRKGESQDSRIQGFKGKSNKGFETKG